MQRVRLLIFFTFIANSFLCHGVYIFRMDIPASLSPSISLYPLCSLSFFLRCSPSHLKSRLSLSPQVSHRSSLTPSSPSVPLRLPLSLSSFRFMDVRSAAACGVVCKSRWRKKGEECYGIALRLLVCIFISLSLLLVSLSLRVFHAVCFFSRSSPSQRLTNPTALHIAADCRYKKSSPCCFSTASISVLRARCVKWEGGKVMESNRQAADILKTEEELARLLWSLWE